MTSDKTSPSPSRWRKGLVLLLFPCLFCFIVLVLALTTEIGFRVLLRTADNLSGPVFSVEEVEGRLLSRWRLGKVQVHLAKKVDVKLDELAFAWSPEMLFQKRLVLHQVAAQGLVVTLTGNDKEDEKEEKDGPVVMPAIKLPLDINLEDLHLRDGRILFSENGYPLILQEVILQANARGRQQGTQSATAVDIQRIKLDLRDYGVDLQGQVAFHDAWPLALKGTWQVADPGINDLDGTVDAQGDLDDLAVLLTMSAPSEVTLEGKVTDILNDLHWQAAAKTGHFQLNDIKVDVPVDGTLTIVDASGTVGSYQGTLAADIHYEGYPPVQAEAKVIADDYTGLAIEYLSVHHEKSTLTTRGKMQWTGGFSWQAELEGKELDPSVVAEKWPGRISGLIQSQGQLSPSGTSLEVNINALNGELAGFPLKGGGGMELNKQGMVFHDLLVQAGSAEVELDGRITKDNSLDLKVRAESDDLSAFFPEYAGSIQLRGTATGNQEHPGIDFVLEGTGLEVAGYKLSKLQADLKADLVMEGEESGMKINELKLLVDEDMSLDATGQIGWAEGLSWQAELRGEQLNPGLFVPEWPGKIQAKIRSQGKKTTDKLVAEVEIDELSGTLRDLPLSGSGKAELDGRKMNVDALHLQSGSTRLDIDGQADEQKVHLVVQARSDDVSPLVPELRGGFEAHVQAQGDPNQPDITLSLSGSGLAYQDYTLQPLQHVQTDLKAKLNLQGQEQGATVDELRMVLDKKSTLAASGQVGWSNGLSWQVDLTGKQLDPSLFLPEWSGNITTEIHSQGRKNGDELIGQVRITELGGKLRDLQLSGSGKVELDNTAVLVEKLRLGLGSGKVEVNGSVDPAQQFDFSFAVGSEDLAGLLPKARGDFQVQGTLKGRTQQPDLDLTVNVGDVQYEGYQLKQLKGRVKADLAEHGRIDADLKASGIRVKDQEISTASVDIQGSTDQHTLELAVVGTPGKVRFAAAGGLKEQTWQGRLTQLSLEHEQFGAWAMPQPADLRLSGKESGKEAVLSGFSLKHNGLKKELNKDLKISLNGAWKQEGGWQVKGSVDDFALKLLQAWKLPVPDLDGTAKARFAAQGQGAVPDQAEFSLDLPKLSLTTESFEDDGEELGTTVWVWTGNTVELQLRDQTARLHARTQFQDNSNANLKLTVKNCGYFSKPEKMPLSGQLDLNLKDLSPIAHLTNEAVLPTGKFGGRILFGGTVRKPTMNGKLALRDGEKKEGEIFLPAAGIGLKDIRVALQGDSRSNTIDAQLSSGEGKIKLTGVVRQDAKQHWLADISISGKKFQAADLPEYSAIISPDLRLRYAETETRLSGTVLLNKAEIAPTGFSGAVSSSGDVIVVDDEQRAKATSPMYLDLKLVMGDEVLVNTFGLKGYLDGSLKINAKPGHPITGLGNLELRDGTFDFEGSTLQLTKGRVFYQGGPIDNPGLDIQASREIDKVELGVRLTGLANDMEMRLFSDTPMDESEILSYLLTGQDISKSGTEDKALSPAAATLGKVGGGVLLKTVDPLKTLDMEGLVDLSIGGGEDASDLSLVMGKEVYKDLYISYGKDLTGAGGTFKARYDLKYGFSIETATNAKTSGADLLFSIEK
ncbi:MAG: translocation/assembly module TamB domain-containing protein [Candidatus Electrothrix sp. Rat3]|nr:translocation/assembly module TamB domain-containing protein [Candidatus Electrothrix rattekaaiensis]